MLRPKSVTGVISRLGVTFAALVLLLAVVPLCRVVGACILPTHEEADRLVPKISCGDIQPIYHPPPDYPPEIEENWPHESVVVEHDILANGSITNAKIVESGDPALNQYVLDAIRQWRYEPSPCLPLKNRRTRFH